MAALLQRNEMRALLAVLVLIALGGALAPVTVQPAAIAGLLPFAAILAIAALGQHLVIQQRGLDISVAGIFSLAAVIVTTFQSGGGGLGEAAALVALALLAGAAFGLLNGLTVTLLGVPPLVVTIAVNSVAFGLVLWLSGGVANSVSPALGHFALGRVLGVPSPLILAAILVCAVAFVVARTTVGRRFQVAGLSPAVGHALGFRVRVFQIGSYVAAGVLFAVAGALFAGLSDVPTLFAGNDYMLATVAAYVVGGNSLAGDRSSVLATGIGAFFLTFLGQLVISLGFDTSVQYLIQAAIVLVGVSLPSLAQRVRAA